MNSRAAVWTTVGIVGAAVRLACGAPAVPASAFEPAFGDEAVAYDQCQERRDGVAAAADPAEVRQVLGFGAADANGEVVKWEGGEAADGKATTFEYLVALKQAAEVGALCVDPADEGYKGSKNNGEVFYLKPDAPFPPDPAAADQWVPVRFAPAQPMTRFATLPPGVRSRAFLYRDIRVAGLSRVDHWRFFKCRVFNVTPEALGVASGGVKSKDPDAVPRGEGWDTTVGARGGRISDKDPSWFALSWERPPTIAGVFLRSNASQFELQYLPPTVASSPAEAEEQEWRPLPRVRSQEARHDFRYYAYSWRWIATPPTAMKALRVKTTEMENKSEGLWINGLGAFADLQSAPVPAVVARDDRPSFRIPYAVPADGVVAMVIEDAQGRRVKPLCAQVERPAGAAEEAWDLKDAAGAYVAPGAYRLRGIVGPPLELDYGITPYPNVDQIWPDRTPWLQGHAGPHGWLSDHSPIQAAAALGERLYFGASMAEAGVCFIECDLGGKKQWGRNNFGAWLGVYMLAADDKALYVAATDHSVYRMDPATREARKLFQHGGAGRTGWLSGMAARAGRVYLAFTGGSSKTSIENATFANNIVLEHSLPALPPGASSADYWYGLVRALRLEGNPPGQNGGMADLATNTGRRRNQYILLAFREPVPLGSVAFPHPGGKAEISFSVLAPGAPYPPRPTEEKDWIPFESNGKPGWNCLAAPPNTLTRALRVTFTNKDFDDLDDALTDVPAHQANTKPDLDTAIDGIELEPKPKAGRSPALAGWTGRLDGMKLIRRRFVSLFPTATVRVNSGTVKADGDWDAARTEAVSEDTPGVYLMEWTAPQKVSGLAVKEIDGARTEVDVWQGPAPAGALPIDAPVLARHSLETGWRNVATYRQKRRSAYHPSADCNPFARYIDGYVDFGEECETRAVRLRIVEQWFDNGDKNAECRRATEWAHGKHYTEQPAARLDTRVCRVYGVAPLQYLGGEVPVAAGAGERVEVRDGQTGELLRDLPARVGWHGLAFGPQGDLYAIEKRHQDVVRVDLETGAMTTVVPKCEPSVMTVGPDGLIYVFPWSDDGRKPVQVYDAGGKRVRAIGAAGGRTPGPWDPQRLGDVVNLTVDRGGGLWVVEGGNYPRRVVHFKTDGAFVKEILGNTFYGGGGGGALDRYDRARAWYGPVEFALDWEKHTSSIRAYLGPGLAGDYVAIRPRGRTETYLASAPHSLGARQGHGVVHRYDPATSTVRMVAAMGDAEGFEPLRASAVVSLLEGDVPKGYTFVWSDLNGNGQVDRPEVQFEPKPQRAWSYGVGPFDSELGCAGPAVRYRVKEYLPGGVPVFERSPAPGSPHLRLDSGNYFTLGASPVEGAPAQNFVTTPAGELVWGYPAGNFGSGLFIPPWQPGVAGYQFSVIGHETAAAGELGEFLVVHANTGEWNLWTADGFLAGQVLLHKGNPRARLFGPAESRPGMRLDPLSASQEHFHGFFTRTEPDNRYYIVAGFTHMSVIEVKGLDRFRRFAAEVKVSGEDVSRVKAWEAARVRRQIAGRALSVTARKVSMAPAIDGDFGPHEWGAGTALDEGGRATFGISYDNANLYVAWRVSGLGALSNAGTEYQRLFKTGAAVDLLLGVDPAAEPGRERPARGDLRLLITSVGGNPKVVLYQPVAPGAPAAERWATRTAAAGETAFDRVVVLENATAATRGTSESYVVEAAIPLAAIGLQPKPGLRLKLDWGVLSSSDGFQVKSRAYWANKAATGTSDESVEARLEPQLWGTVRFEGAAEDDLEL